MKLQPDKAEVQTIQSYGPGWIGIQGERLTHSLVISSRGDRLDWRCNAFSDLSATHFDQLSQLGAELILFGSGTLLRFPRPDWLRSLVQQRVGVETMDTAAACRTYNILASEGRHVVAALLLENP